jgi:hypothetical protein
MDVLDHKPGDACDDAGLDEGADDDEEPAEEEEGRPLDLFKDRLRGLPAPDEEDRGADQGDEGGFQAEPV